MSDVEGSTGLLRKLGDRGDELFAVFERPTVAVEAGVAIQHELAGRRWADDVEVRVRIGIHSGRPTLTETGCVGLAVHVTARICSAAHGGQILISAATRAAIAASAPAGVRFRNLGRHRLPGLADPELLFRVQASGLRASFPRPRIQRGAAPRRRRDERAAGRGTRAAGGQLELPQPPG